MGKRFDATTEHLRDAACALLLEHGVRAFSSESLAKSGFVSVGAVYERWGSKSDILHDLFATRMLKPLEAIADDARRDEPVSLFTAEPRANETLRLAIEAMFAARDDPSFIEIAQQALLGLEQACAHDMPTGVAQQSRYTAMLLVGIGLLQTGSCPIPDLAKDLASLIGTDRSPTPNGPFEPAPSGEGVPVLMPPVGDVAPTDETGEALRASTRQLLQSEAPRATARSIADNAGVSTGAMYRRFSSTSELFVDVLMTELQDHRYTWMASLVEALNGTDPIDSGSAVMATALASAVANNPTNRMLLEITVSARTDPGIRDKLVAKITDVAQARAPIFAHLQTAGLVRPDIAPETFAWLLQAPPIGGRLLGAINLAPSQAELQSAIAWIATRSLV